MRKLDRYIFFRLALITFFVTGLLICIFILIDFSENSDDFLDRGAELAVIWRDYYLNYIPEMFRLISPLAVFTACLFLTGQMTERLEVTAIKSTGISLYRLALPYLFFGALVGGSVSFLDAYIIPESNAERMEFERRYMSGSSERIDRGTLYRQATDSSIISFNFFDPNTQIGYRATLVEFSGDEISRIITANRLNWVDSTSTWLANRYTERTFNDLGFIEIEENNVEVPLNLYPRDLARRSSDIYQLTYPEAFQYIASIERIGAGGISLPMTQLYVRIAYPISILVVCLIGFAIAAEKRKGGKGFYIAAGLTISFIYLAFMKVIEPFGAAGSVSPLVAAFLPHTIFLLFGLGLLFYLKK